VTAPRVVSLVPSVTETLVALGVVPVACTRFCDLAGVRTVGGTKNPDIPAIVGLAPDLVVVNDEENRRQDADALEAAGLAVHSMSPRSVEAVGGAVRALATRLGVAPPGAFAPSEWDAWCERTRAEPAGGARGRTRRRAFVAVWRRPWMSLAADTYGASLLGLLGVDNVFADAAARYPEVTLAEVAARAPTLVVLPSEPYEFRPEHGREVEQALPGVPVRFVDGRDLFWWGVRSPAAAARLANALVTGPVRRADPGLSTTSS